MSAGLLPMRRHPDTMGRGAKGIPKVLDHEQIVPAVSDGRIGLVKTENADFLLPVGVEIQAAIDLLRRFAQKLMIRRPASRIGPTSRPGSRESARRFEARISSAEKPSRSSPCQIGSAEGKYPSGKLFQLPQIEPPLVQACPGGPPSVVPALAGRQKGLGRRK